MCVDAFKRKPDVNPAVVQPFQSQGLRSRDLHSPARPTAFSLPPHSNLDRCIRIDQNNGLHQGRTSLDYPKTWKLKISLRDFHGTCWEFPLQEGEIPSGDYFFKK